MKKTLFALSALLLLLFASCEEEGVMKDDIQQENGYVKGTIKGTLDDGTIINEKINLKFSEPGNNTISENNYNGSTTESFYISQSNSIDEMLDRSCSCSLSIKKTSNSETLNSLRIRINKVLKNNKYYSISLEGTRDLGLKDLEYDDDSHTISGKISGEIDYDYTDDDFAIDLEFKTKVWEKVR